MKLEDIKDFKEFVPRSKPPEEHSNGSGDAQPAESSDQCCSREVDDVPQSPVASQPLVSMTTGEVVDWFEQLLAEKRQLESVGNLGLVQVPMLLDAAIAQAKQQFAEAVRGANGSLTSLSIRQPSAAIPTPIPNTAYNFYENRVLLSEKIMVPVNEYPDYNFAGRLLGPRGMTVKQMERDTGCRIQVRGKGSMKKNESLDKCDDLHVMVTVEDVKEAAEAKLARAKEAILRLMTPGATSMDSLKRKQLMELAIINGNYRPSRSSVPDIMPPMAPGSSSGSSCYGEAAGSPMAGGISEKFDH